MISQMMLWIKYSLLRLGVADEGGQTLIEYALLVVLIAIVVIVALTLLGPIIANVFTNIGTILDSGT